MKRALVVCTLMLLFLAGVVVPASASGARRVEGTPILIASASYPGLGQLLNGKDAKAAAIGAAEAFLIAGLVVEDRRTRNAYRNYQETRDQAWFDEYSVHYDRRQTLLWWAVGAALYAIADAYVDAELFGFGGSLSEDLDRSLWIDAENGAERVEVGLTIRF